MGSKFGLIAETIASEALYLKKVDQMTAFCPRPDLITISRALRRTPVVQQS